MGLDMYLEKMPKIKGYSFEKLIGLSNLITEDLKKFKEDSKHYEVLESYFIKQRKIY